MNLPNKITIARILLLPLFMWVILVPDWGTTVILGVELDTADFVGTLIFSFAAATDALDGYLARKNGQVTNLGKFLDPLADKLLVSVALILLVGTGAAPSWVVALIIAREFAVTGIRLVLAGEGEVVAAANLGKIKTATQMTAIIMLLLNLPDNRFGIQVDMIMLYISAFLTVWSGWDVFWVNRSSFTKSM